MEEKDSFAAALKKAREIAAKMQVNSKPLGQDEASKKNNSDPNAFDNKKRLALQIANNLSRRIPKDIRVISQGLNRNGELVIHMMIPSVLVCLFAGRNNETLEWMQGSSGVTMEMNLEHPYANANEKPLTIIGEPDKVESAREVVSQYIREKDELLGINANNMQISLGIEYSELQIPKEAIGLVIGKQGENIKKVNNETGCVVKFKPPGPFDDDRYRICTFQGTTGQIKKAREQISELVEFLKQKFGLARPVPGPGQEFEEVRVSAAKAGIVIGKGGENIKQINNLSGATVCIDRSIPDGSMYRTFFVVGTRQQVEHAKFLIREKSGEAGDLPLNALMALNPMIGGSMDPWANQPPMPPMFAAPIQHMAFDQSLPMQQVWYPPSVHSQQYSESMVHQQIAPQCDPPNQDYSQEWAAYYQQYYSQSSDPSTQPLSDVPTDPEAYAAYYQSYCQQYYSQNPEYYQQMMSTYNQNTSYSEAQVQNTSTTHTPTIEKPDEILPLKPNNIISFNENSETIEIKTKDLNVDVEVSTAHNEVEEPLPSIESEKLIPAKVHDEEEAPLLPIESEKLTEAKESEVVIPLPSPTIVVGKKRGRPSKK